MRKYITKASERIGVESTSRDGKRAQVVSYSSCENFIIRFCDGKEMKLKNWRYFIEGNFNYEKHFKAPRNREERIGEKKVMNNGLTAEVIEYRGSHDMDILFEDGGKRTGVSWRDFCIGSIAHPTIPGGNVSQNELVLRFYLESLGFVRIPQRSKRSDRVGLEGKELDLYNDKLKIAIEYDGEYSHTKNKDDEGKNKIVEKLGIKLYRFREPGCSGVSGRNYILEDSRFMSASLECCLKSFVRDVLKKDDKFINFEKDKRTIKEYVSNNKRATIHLYEKKKMNNGMVAEIIKMSSCRNITVQFEDGEIVYHKCYQKSTHNRRERPVCGHRGRSRGPFYYRITTFGKGPWDARDPHKTTFMALKHVIRLSIWQRQKETPGVEKAPGVSSPQRKESGRSGRDDGELRFGYDPAIHARRLRVYHRPRRLRMASRISIFFAARRFEPLNSMG